MKKYFFLAAAALVAMCACTKTVVNEAPDQAIGFNVASYVPQTKAGEVSIIGETKSFHTYAFYHVNKGAAQAYFTAAGEDITPDSESNPSKWAPSRVYYWPKTGSINFYSYYGSQAPVVTDGSLTYADKTIGATDNIVFADPAFCQTANQDKYQMDAVKEGVPTLFHHALCQIAFDANVSKENDKADDWTEDDPFTTWEVTILSASLVVDNKGTLTLKHDVPAETAAPSNPAWLESYDVPGWVPASSTETINMTALPTTTVLTKTAQSILGLRSAMPQEIDNTNVFSIKYQIKTIRSWDASNPAIEVVEDSKKLSEFNETLTSWNMNKKITYHITINPVDQQILFDPALENWIAVDGGNITLPTE